LFLFSFLLCLFLLLTCSATLRTRTVHVEILIVLISIFSRLVPSSSHHLLSHTIDTVALHLLLVSSRAICTSALRPSLPMSSLLVDGLSSDVLTNDHLLLDGFWHFRLLFILFFLFISIVLDRRVLSQFVQSRIIVVVLRRDLGGVRGRNALVLLIDRLDVDIRFLASVYLKRLHGLSRCLLFIHFHLLILFSLLVYLLLV
ncbi:hypothetical protein PFISCL1PPCAC_28142, partial [Pristionchus fissidentatus]